MKIRFFVHFPEQFLFAGVLCIMEGMKSPKETALERVLLRHLPAGTPERKLGELLVADPYIQALQDQANIVAIKRLGYNDHGPVHMRQVAVNALVMLRLLHKAGVATSLEKEGAGSYDDAACGVLLAAFLHDLGMTVGRTDHELTGLIIARPIMERLLAQVYPDDVARRVAVLSLASEGIFGHMASRRIHSVEAGLVMIADGCDMEKGRARIPLLLESEDEGTQGDIHKYSANSIERVTISQGTEHPIRIDVEMSSEVGFFQIEEVLLQKINMSPDKNLVEVYAGVVGAVKKRYL